MSSRYPSVRPRPQARPRVDLNVTPLIDVLLVLLVIFNVLAIGLCVVRVSPEGREFWEHAFGKWPIDLFTIAAILVSVLVRNIRTPGTSPRACELRRTKGSPSQFAR